jgi:PEGA domain-containing protein
VLRSVLCGSVALLVAFESVALADRPLSLKLPSDYRFDPRSATDLEVPQPPEAQRTTRMATRTVAILIISGEEIGVPLSEIYSNARRVIESSTALTVAPLDVISREERTEAIQKCAGDGACFAGKFRAIAANVGLLLTVSADRLDEGFLLGFRLVDVETQKEIGAAGDEIPVGMSMIGAMENQLPSVFPASIWGQIATVSIESDPPGAEISVGGRSCVSPCELARMVPGRYDITIRKAGYAPYQGTVTLAAKDTAKVSQALKVPDSSIVASPLFWGIIAAVVVVGGAISFIALRPSDRTVNICIADRQSLCQ